MNPFKKITDKAIEEAEAVDCPMEEFRLGLGLMWHVLKERLEVEDVSPIDPEVLDYADAAED